MGKERLKAANFRLSEALLEDLQTLSLIMNKSQTDIVREAIARELLDHAELIDEYNRSLKAIQDKLPRHPDPDKEENK
jgi:predicted DNA-binding protein